nr:MAG TPA: hypothetical protein [Caudoviricetes sp.]DAR35284.1 MAG TPA: hypothetical protein [Caudoviricetes sp.]
MKSFRRSFNGLSREYVKYLYLYFITSIRRI